MTKYYGWLLFHLSGAGPALAHGQELGDLGEQFFGNASGSLWMALGLGAVLVLAYGVSWAVARPLVRRAEADSLAELARCENGFLRAALDGSGSMLLLVDGEGRVVLGNELLRRQVPGEVLPAGQKAGAALGSPALQSLVERALQGEEVAGQVVLARGGASARVVPLRRAGSIAGAVATFAVFEERAGLLRLDPLRQLAYVEERRVDLTQTEFRLLAHLHSRPDQVQSREVLLCEVWGHERAGHSRTVDTHVRRLREKLGEAGALIATVRGAGYCFRPGAGA